MIKLYARLLISCILTFTSVASHSAGYQDQKVVYHVNYGDTHRIEETMINISNHLAELGEGHVDIKVVVHGKAVEYFMSATEDEAKQMTLDSLRLRDVQFLMCGNTLDGYNITVKDLYDVEATDIVKAGLPAIVDLQQKGYIYVRP